MPILSGGSKLGIEGFPLKLSYHSLHQYSMNVFQERLSENVCHYLHLYDSTQLTPLYDDRVSTSTYSVASHYNGFVFRCVQVTFL